MTNEQILSEFQNLAKSEAKKVTEKFEAELKTENKVATVAPKWNLKPSFSTVITDVTPEGSGN